MLDPDVLLLDEPLGALDPMIRHELQGDLRDIFRPLGQDGGARHPRPRRGRLSWRPGGADARGPHRPAGPARRAGARSRRPLRHPLLPGAAPALRGAWRMSSLAACAAARARRVLRASSDGPAVRVGSKKFTESVILGEMATQLVREHRGSGRAPARARRHPGALGRPAPRRDRRLPRVHRHAARRRSSPAQRLPDDEALRQALAAEGVRMSAPARLQRHLRARHEGDRGRAPRHPAHLRPARAPRAALRLQQRVHGPRRRLARRCATATRCRSGTCAGSTTTWPTAAWTSGAHRRDRPLLDRRGDRATTTCACSRTTCGTSPTYDAVLLYRADLAEHAPEVVAALGRLEGRISEPEMIGS